jgi:hypothetical protein
VPAFARARDLAPALWQRMAISSKSFSL